MAGEMDKQGPTGYILLRRTPAGLVHACSVSNKCSISVRLVYEKACNQRISFHSFLYTNICTLGLWWYDASKKVRGAWFFY